MGTTLQMALPAVTTSAGLMLIAGAAALLLAHQPRPVAPHLPPPQTATVAPTTLTHRLDGEYNRAGQPVDAPLVSVRIGTPLDIMRYQVTAADYALCVAASACKRLESRAARGDLPVTGVSHGDATNYAIWLSHATGMNWRLPTDLGMGACRRLALHRRCQGLRSQRNQSGPALARQLRARSRPQIGEQPGAPPGRQLRRQ